MATVSFAANGSPVAPLNLLVAVGRQRDGLVERGRLFILDCAEAGILRGRDRFGGRVRAERLRGAFRMGGVRSGMKSASALSKAVLASSPDEDSHNGEKNKTTNASDDADLKASGLVMRAAVA